jgi:hypothetical protein
MYVFGTFAVNQVAVAAWVYFWVFYSVSLVYVSIFVPVLGCFVTLAP